MMAGEATGEGPRCAELESAGSGRREGQGLGRVGRVSTTSAVPQLENSELRVLALATVWGTERTLSL